MKFPINTEFSRKESLLGKAIIITMLLTAVVVVASIGAHADESAKLTPSELLHRAAQAIHVKNEESIYEMHLIGADGKEDGFRKMHVWFKSNTDDDGKLLIKFTEPANIRGTGLLTLMKKGETTEQWLYLPAYRKTRRVRKGNENESFLGSDFSMADISAEHEGSFDFKLDEKTQKCDGGECYVLVGTPKADLDKDSAVYSKKIAFVRTDNYLNVRTEMYGQDGKLEKLMVLSNIHQDHGKRWVADKMEMKNLATGHKTVLEFQKRDLSQVPRDSIFTESFLEKGV